MLNGYKIIALCLSRIYDAPIVEFVSALNEKLIKHGYRIFLYHISKDFLWNEEYDESETMIFELMDYSVIDTIVVMDETIKSKALVKHIISKAGTENIPVIIVDGYYKGCINVQFDYKTSFEKIVRHVMDEHKPENVHFMAGIKGDKFSQERENVFCTVMKEYGVDVTPEMISYGNFWADPTIEAMNVLLDKGIVPDAFICANDIMAINVIAVLKERGYTVPKDIIVTGFDGVEEIHFTEPKITTAVCNYAELSDITANLICKEVKSGDYYAVPEFLASESCGCTYNSKINILDRFSGLNRRFYRYQDDNRILTEIIEKMQYCNSVDELSVKMNDKVISDMCCVLNKRCLDNTIDPKKKVDNYFEEDMYLLYDARESENFVPQNFKRKDIAPNIDILLEQNYPLVFSALDYMNTCFGYVCFYFRSCDSANYGRIPQIVNLLSNGIGSYINHRYQSYLTKQIEHMYTHDALTGLYNRLGFTYKCDMLIDKAKKEHELVTIVLADLDNLKYINDNYGHVGGDNAIYMVAKALEHGSPSNALCVRFGGDEMLAVMKGDYDTSLIRHDIIKYLDDYNSKKECPYTVSSSLGLYQVQATDEISFESLLKEADVRMYEDKKMKKLKNNIKEIIGNI